MEKIAIGLDLDHHPHKQPNGTYRFALNVQSEKSSTSSLTNEN